MAKYRKKPIVIEALQYHGEFTQEIGDFLLGTVVTNTTEGRLAILTLEGFLTVSNGDWIIRGIKGEHYPCKPDIFDATYEPADHEHDIFCLAGFRTAEEFVAALKVKRPDWFRRSIDLVGGESCKFSTETIKP